MAVKAETLETPERGLNLVTRDGPEEERAGKAKKAEASAELAAMRERIDAAKRLEPSGAQMHCRDCFHKGRDTAIKAIEGLRGQ